MNYPEDFKRAHGLTNHEIAEGLANLSDDDFLEVFMELSKLHFGEDSDEFKLEPIGSYMKVLEMILHEIQDNVEEWQNEHDRSGSVGFSLLPTSTNE